MAARKSREQEELEARLRAKRAYERRLQDIAWKHEEFLPIMDDYKALLMKKKEQQKELEPPK